MYMKEEKYFKPIFENIEEIDEPMYWLKRSYGICQRIGIKEKYADDEFDAFETLTFRFVRLSGILLSIIVNGVDKIRFEREETTWDVFTREHKKGLVESVTEIKEINELRQTINNENKPSALTNCFKEILGYSKVLLDIGHRLKQYGVPAN
ncbi:MAG: hypothetical protein ACM3SY_14200 [Candidatus Omnitrophota bacterium]